jgi:ABC-type nitrate/sulfonate/bicarbonate transport system substrate-binding protein
MKLREGDFQMLTRRSLLKNATILGAGMAAAPALVRAQAKEPLALMTPFGFIPDFIEMMNAVSGGHFAREGFDARILGGQGTSQAVQQLTAGKVALIRAAAIDQIRAVSSIGAPLVAISTLYQASTFHLVSLKDKPVLHAEDLKGKTVGIVSVAGTTEIFLDLMLSKVGLKKEDAKREVTGNSPGALQLVKAGRVDCFICSTNVLIALEHMNEPIESWSTDRYAPMPGQVYVTTQDLIDTKSDMLLRAIRALHASVEEVMKGPLKPIYQRAAKDFEIGGIKDLDTVVEVEKYAIDKLWLSEGRDNLMRNVPKLWTSGVDALNSAGITQIKDVKALYTNTFVDRLGQ